MNHIQERIKQIEQLSNSKTTAAEIRRLRKDEKNRVNQENQYLTLLYRFQKVAQDEKLAFVQKSCELFNITMHVTDSIHALYDFVAQIYMKFFTENIIVEKAVKLRLIFESQMHRNQSFLILLIKWLLEHYRESFNNLLMTTVPLRLANFLYESPIRHEPFQVRTKAMTIRQPMFQTQKQSTYKRFSSLIDDSNRESNPALNSSMDKGYSCHTATNSIVLNNKTIRQRLEKIITYPQKSAESPFESGSLINKNLLSPIGSWKKKFKSLKEKNLYYMHMTHKVMTDVDWEYMRTQDTYKLKYMLLRNAFIQKTIQQCQNGPKDQI